MVSPRTGCPSCSALTAHEILPWGLPSPAPSLSERTVACVGGFEFDTPKAKIEEALRQIIEAMPLHVNGTAFPKCIDLRVMGEMSSTGAIKFANHSGFKIFAGTYRHTLPLASKHRIKNEPLWVTFHKPLSERRHTRILDLLAAHLKASGNSEQESLFVVCRVKGAIWFTGKRIFAYRYSTGLA